MKEEVIRGVGKENAFNRQKKGDGSPSSVTDGRKGVN